MPLSPILLLHIASGTLGMLSGFVAVFLRKGSRRHGLAGSVFVISMLILSASGAYMAILKHQPGNILGGTLTFYLVATAWMTARRRNEVTGIFDWGSLLVVLAVAAVEVTFGFEAANNPTGLRYGYPPGPYFFMGSVAVLATVGDVRMLVRRGISGTRRIARHLWRMCFALFIAAASIFLARQQRFPAVLQKTGVLVFLSVLPLLLMIFWLVRVRFRSGSQTRNHTQNNASTPIVRTVCSRQLFGRPGLTDQTMLCYNLQAGRGQMLRVVGLSSQDSSGCTSSRFPVDKRLYGVEPVDTGDSSDSKKRRENQRVSS